MALLILKRASASRPSGEWSDDDYDVLAENEVVGRIFNSAASPVGTPMPRRRRSQRVGEGNDMDRENSMRAIGLVSLSIAIMALLLTDADAKRRSSAQGSQAAGASRSWCETYGRKGIRDNCSYATQQQCLAQVWGLGGFCRPNSFPGTAYGTDIPGRQVRRAGAARGYAATREAAMAAFAKSCATGNRPAPPLARPLVR
jgi:hypothetical protein